jgi:hypothetical protein
VKETPPTFVKIALGLFGLFVLARCYQMRVRFDLYRYGEITGIELLLRVALIGLFIYVGVQLGKRSTWARWALIAIAAWQLYDLHWGIRDLWFGGYGVPIQVMDIVMWMLPAACSVGATILVFGPARDWFRQTGKTGIAS